MPAPLHEEIRRFVENSQAYESVDQLCREAAEALIKEHRLTGKAGKGGRKEWKSVNIPEEHYQKIQAWIKTGRAPYVSVDEAVRDAIRNVILQPMKRRR
jgi:hypothetical protein